jgi:hypothetical protein
VKYKERDVVEADNLQGAQSAWTGVCLHIMNTLPKYGPAFKKLSLVVKELFFLTEGTRAGNE